MGKVELKLRKVAVTGGLSCGKSSVCRILKELGAYVVSADTIVHQLLSSDVNLGQEIIRLLGSSVLVDQKLDRTSIARIVFNDLKRLRAFEGLIHPLVYRELNKEYLKQQSLPHSPPLFVAEIPLLYESDGQKEYDITVAVVAPSDICIKRFEETSSQDREEYHRRVGRQLPLEEKARRADYVISNEGSLFDLHKKTVELYQELIKE